MRRILLYIFTCLWLSVSATNTLSFSPLDGHPGDTLDIAVMLENSDAVTALQVDIPLNTNLQYIDGSASIDSHRSNGHQLVAHAANDTLHVTIFSLSQAALNNEDGDIFTFRVRLGNEPATYPLAGKTVITGTAGQALAAGVEQGSITIYSPKIQIVSTSLDYGHVPIRATYTKTLQVRNTGNEPLHITDIVFSAAEFSVSSTEFTIPAAQTQNIVVTFAPMLHGAISENVRLRSDAINDPDVYGANICALVADPYSVNELRMQAASGISDDTVTVRVRMNNMESIVGAQFSIKMPTALEFIDGSAAALERASGHSVLSTMSNDTLTLLLYHPSNEAVSGDDGDLLSFRVRLNGTTGSYALKPVKTMLVNTAQQNMVSAVYQANVTIQSPKISSNASLAFGHIRADQPHTVSYAIRNTGQVPLTVERVTFLSEGLRVVTELPIVIAKNATQYIDIELTPWQEGAFATTMQVYSNDPTTRMKSVNLTADVYEPNSLTFRGHTFGTEYRLAVDLTNYSDIAGVQFDVEGLMPWTSYALSPRVAKHQVVVQPIDETRHRVIIFAMDNSLIEGHDGVLMEWNWQEELVPALNGKTISMDNVVLVHPTKGNREVEAAAPVTVDYQPGEGTDLDQVSDEPLPATRKILHNGQIYILRGEKVYTIQGIESFL